MRNNRISRPNVVTWRAAAEQMDVTTRYSGVRPNNNTNNHATLGEHFQQSTMHKLRQLGLYANTETPYTAHQLDVEAVAAEVAYTMTDT